MATLSCGRKSHNYIPVGLVSALILVLFSACASSPLNLTHTQTIPRNEGIAFGRVKVFSEGNERKGFSTILGESTMSVLVLPDNSSQGTSFPLRDAGFFFWHLPLGGYTIAGFEGLTTELFRHLIRGRVSARFQVLPDAATYIGTLTLMFEGSRYAKFVEDDYERAVEEFRKRFPQIKGEETKSLMVMEKER